MSLPRFVSLGGPMTDTHPVRPSCLLVYYDLITFLGVVQSHKIDILPITWQSSLERLGFGGTAEINQSFVNLQTSFAFKRVAPPGGNDTSSEDESILYQALACEISVLSHPILRDHPHISNLVAVCWDTTSEDGKVTPVLVTEKTQFGDMYQFAKSQIGQRLSSVQRLRMCYDIGSAIITMHASGDIKPHNVLIFKDGHEGYTAKLTDFGYSTILASEDNDETVNIAMSVPWTAPEHWLGRNYTMAEAKATDMYSFGLLCLWLLFSKELNDLKEVYSMKGCVDFEDTLQEENIIEDLKRENMMQQLAVDIVARDNCVGMTNRDQLERLFNVTLCAAPDRCDECFQYAVTTMLNGDACQLLGADSSALRTSVTPTNFQVSRNIVQLLTADYRVRPQILDSLKGHANDSPDVESAQNAAFQCSVCYSIGLGVARDELQSMDWLSRSGKSSAQLEKELASLRRLETVKLRDTNDLLELLNVAGSGNIMDYTDQYRKDLQKVHKWYRREILDMQTFTEDANHQLVQVLERILVPILEEMGDFRQAEELRLRHLASVEARFGPNHRDTLTSIENLASNLTLQGRYNESETMTRHVLSKREVLLGDGHMHTLNSMSNLAAQLARQGKYEEAGMMEGRVLQGAMGLFGRDHQNTLISAGKLAGIWEEMGDFGMVEELQREILRSSEANLGADHRDTLLSMAYLAHSLGLMGSQEEALELCHRTLTKMQAMVGRRHPDTLGVMGTLAMLLDAGGDSASAAEILREAVDTASEILGQDHPRTLQHQVNLGQTLLDMGQNVAAEQMLMQVLEKNEQILGSRHPTTLEARSSFANALVAQGKYREATRLQIHVVHRMEEIYTKRNPSYLASLHNLADMLALRGDHHIAEMNAREAYEGREGLFGARHESTLSSLSLIGTILHMSGRREEAWEIKTTALDGMKRTLGEEHPITLGAIRETANLANGLGRYVVAQDLYQRAFEGYSKISPTHPITLASQHGLGSSLMWQSKYEEAETIQRVVLEQRRAILGAEHPDTKSTHLELAVGLSWQGRREEATDIMRDILAWSREYWGEDHRNTMSNAISLGDALSEMRRYDEAEKLFEWVLDTRERKLGSTHADTLLAVNNFASVLQHQKKYARAAAMYRQVIDGCKSASNNTDLPSLSLTAFSNLGGVLSDIGDYADAEAILLLAIEENRTVHGESSRRTITSMRTLAMCYQRANKPEEAAAMIFEVGKIVDRHNLWKDGKYE